MHMPGQTRGALGNKVTRNGNTTAIYKNDVGVTSTAIQGQDGVVNGTTVDGSRVHIPQTGKSMLRENAMHMPGQTKGALGNEVTRNGEQRRSPGYAGHPFSAQAALIMAPPLMTPGYIYPDNRYSWGTPRTYAHDRVTQDRLSGSAGVAPWASNAQHGGPETSVPRNLQGKFRLLTGTLDTRGVRPETRRRV